MNRKADSDDQTDANKNEKKIEYYKTGQIEWIGYRDTGELWEIANYQNGVRVGIWSTFYQEGNILRTDNYGESINELRERITFYQNGQIRTKGKCQGSEPNRSLIQKNRLRMLRIKAMKIGIKREGTWITYFENGQTWLVENYTINKNKETKDGEWIEYYPNGRVKEKINYKNDILHGAHMKFLENGEIILKNHYLNGGPDGEVIKRYDSGNVKTKQNYKNNCLHGCWMAYYEDGQISEEGNYLHGQKHGEWISYQADGEISSLINYLHGDQHGITISYRDGKAINQASYKNEIRHGEWISYHENGQIRAKTNYVDGLSHGENTHYYANGQIESRENYQKGVCLGQMINYFRNGQICRKANISKGHLSGEYLEYYESGQIKEKGNYVKGQKEGEWIFYDENGKLQRVNFVQTNNETPNSNQTNAEEIKNGSDKRYTDSNVEEDYLRTDDNPYYNDDLDMDQQSEEFWDNL